MADKDNKNGSEMNLTDDEYGDAFDEFVEGGAGTAGTGKVDTDGDGETGAEGDGGDGGGGEETGSEGSQGTIGNAPIIEKDTRNDEIVSKYEEKEREYQEQITALKADLEKIKKKATTSDIDYKENLTEDEKKELDGYEEEFEEVSKYEKHKRKLEMAAMEKRIMQSITESLSEVTDSVSKLSNFALEYSREKHLSYIRGKHDDFDDLVDSGKVAAWIKTQPKEVKEVYQNWYDKGNAEQVVSLFNLYKEKNKQPEKKDDSTKQDKKDAFTAVPRKNTPISTTTPAKDDFEGAFDEFANSTT